MKNRHCSITRELRKLDENESRTSSYRSTGNVAEELTKKIEWSVNSDISWSNPYFEILDNA